MQTFLPFSNFESVKFLDRARLGKQRSEVIQLLISLILKTKYSEHVVTRAWRGYEHALARYGLVVCDTWKARGYRDSCKEKISAFIGGDLNNVKLDKTGKNVLDLISDHGTFPDTGLPWWLGDEKLHSNHRARLLAKKFEHYRQFGWIEAPTEKNYYPLPMKTKKT